MVFGGCGSVFRVFLAGENSGIVHPVCGVGAGEMGFGTCVSLIYMKVLMVLNFRNLRFGVSGAKYLSTAFVPTTSSFTKKC